LCDENILKIGPVYPEIFVWMRQFLPCHTKSSVNSGVSELKFTKLLHDIEASLMLLMHTLMKRYSILF